MCYPRSSYTYEVGKHLDQPYIAIEDRDIGSMSVTNDISNVCEYLLHTLGFKLHEMAHYIWVYKDSDDIWDGYDPINNKFIPLSKLRLIDAIERYHEIRFWEMHKFLQSCKTH